MVGLKERKESSPHSLKVARDSFCKNTLQGVQFGVKRGEKNLSHVLLFDGLLTTRILVVKWNETS